jgi:uncharacterized protein YecE (DUF72 family)
LKKQLGLFGADFEKRIDDHAALVELAARLPPHVRFGTSSWTFREWRSLVYVDTNVSSSDFVRDSLEEYARHPLLRTVGIDRSFYAPLTAAELRAYAAQLPAGFRAVSKVWSELTTPIFPEHARFGVRAGHPSEHFFDATLFTERVAQPFLEAFVPHLGPFVIEVPRAPVKLDPIAFADALAGFLEKVPRDLDYAVELRDPKLIAARYFEVLAAHGATHVFNYWTRMPSIGEQLAMPGALREGTRVVVRLMVPPRKKYEVLKREWAPFDRIRVPDPAMRADVTELLARAGSMGSEVFVIANNKAEGCAPLTVRALAEALARR